MPKAICHEEAAEQSPRNALMARLMPNATKA
jgi:hypothetical protein